MEKPYYNHKGITIYHGDCLELAPSVECDLVLTDPPYGINEVTTRGSSGRSGATASLDFNPIHGDDKPFDPLPFLRHKCILWGANHYADKLSSSSTWFVWDKRDGIPSNDNSDFEMAWSNIGGPARLFRHLWSGMLKASEKNRPRTHPTLKPVALMLWCLRLAKIKSGGLVFDPYMGSGPVAEACKIMGLKYIGVEIVEKYCEAATNRLSQEVLF